LPGGVSGGIQYTHTVQDRFACNLSEAVVLVGKFFRVRSAGAAVAIRGCAGWASMESWNTLLHANAGYRNFIFRNSNSGCCSITVSAVEDRVRPGRSLDPFAAILVRERRRYCASCGHPGAGRANRPPGWLVHSTARRMLCSVNASLTIIALNETKNTHRLHSTRVSRAS
jgi:hypothetical protein